MQYGSNQKLPHVVVIGQPIDFYVWLNEGEKGSASKWIHGAGAFEHYNKMRQMYGKDKQGFIEYAKMLHKENQ